MLGVLNQTLDEHFTVYNECNSLVSNIDSTAFTVYIYDPNGNEVSSTVGGGFVNLGNGNYKYQFTPNLLGTWYVVITHPTYFSFGKADDIQVYSGDLTGIYDTVIRTLGLVHSNIFIDQPVYDENGNLISARVRIYSDALSVGTNSNVIETYKIESDGTECGQFSYWKQIKL